MNHTITRFLFATALALPLLAPAASVVDGGNQTGNSAPARAMKHDGHHGHHGHHGKGRHGHGHRHDRDGKPFFLRGITLSAEQDGKLQALLKEQQPALEAQKEAAHKARTELQQLTLSGRFDEKQAKRLADASAAARAGIDLARARQHAKIVQLLTPEQRQQAEKNVQEKAARHATRQSVAPQSDAR
ncbi:MAG: motif family protein [Moraxellaceae bacterium]|jgi:Spy/CpxP family protein refolding chaperone|nr:motif family protein [Moraxellaceae bacterium]